MNNYLFELFESIEKWRLAFEIVLTCIFIDIEMF